MLSDISGVIGNWVLFIHTHFVFLEELSWEICISIIILSILLTGCSGVTQEIPPTSTPKPTWTQLPHGTLKACIYFEGKLVDIGYLRFFYNKREVISSLNYRQLSGGCREVILTPGYYIVNAKYYQGVCDYTGANCSLEEDLHIDISDGDVIEKDYEIFTP